MSGSEHETRNNSTIKLCIQSSLLNARGYAQFRKRFNAESQTHVAHKH